MIPRLLLAGLLLLTGCGAVPIAAPRGDVASTPDTTIADGSSTAELAVGNFLSDLGIALADRSLRQASVQRYWADRLASYFAPVERSRQRAAIGDMLVAFARDQQQLAADEAALVEVLFGTPSIVSRSGGRVLVQVPEGRIRMVITRLVDRTPTIIYEQEIALATIVGRTDTTLPVTQIGARWYLTST